MQKLKAILFDADGVVQRVPAIRDELIWELVDKRRTIDELFEDISHAGGEDDFLVKVAGILDRWGSKSSTADFLELWFMIEPDHQIMSLVTQLAQQYQICLATNQEPNRAKHMAKVLGYDHVFDQSFYSCELGVTKPSAAFFNIILQELSLQAREVLFIDDHDENVNAAIQVGLHAEIFHVDEGAKTLTKLLKKYDINVE